METINQKLPRSTRRYPKKQCANSNCTHDKIFAPHDFRQLYCCADCRKEAGNDKRRQLNKTKFADEKILRENDKKLEKIYTRWKEKNGFCQVQLIILQHEAIDPSLYVFQNFHKASGQKINWLYHYGTTLNPNDNNWVIIYKKPTT